MSARQQLNELAERRRLLLVEADLHRALLRADCEAVRAKFSGLRSVRDQLAGHKPLLMGAAGVAGLLAMRHWRRVAAWLPLVVRGLRMLRSWQAGSSRRAT
jgi:hypothetical protein